MVTDELWVRSESLIPLPERCFRHPGPLPSLRDRAALEWVVEIACGVLVVIGLLTCPAAVPLLIDISGAIVLTRLPELRPGGFGGVEGFWDVAHDARTDFAMLLGLIFLPRAGPGRWSLDSVIAQRAQVACGRNRRDDR